MQGCLGALDGTHIKLHVPSSDRPRSKMSDDPFEAEVEDIPSTSHPVEYDEEEELIQTCKLSNVWTEWRDKLAKEMFTTWMASK
ncbi:hypothetical protein PTKIN_Ptkin01aG0099800 [Pterospermum kingtungense]